MWRRRTLNTPSLATSSGAENLAKELEPELEPPELEPGLELEMEPDPEPYSDPETYPDALRMPGELPSAGDGASSESLPLRWRTTANRLLSVLVPRFPSVEDEMQDSCRTPLLLLPWSFPPWSHSQRARRT